MTILVQGATLASSMAMDQSGRAPHSYRAVSRISLYGVVVLIYKLVAQMAMFLSFQFVLSHQVFGQQPNISGMLLSSGEKASRPRQFEVATIKLSSPDNGGLLGFFAFPSGRVTVGNATVTRIIEYAFDVQDFQIVGGPDWMKQTRFDIVGVPSDSSEESSQESFRSAFPTEEQREMLRSLLIDRFSLKIHHIKKYRSALVLVSVDKDAHLLARAKDPHADPRGGIGIDDRGIANGDAYGRNFSMTDLAKAISQELESPVIDGSGLVGGFDFLIQSSEPNQGEGMDSVISALRPLGLRLKRSKALVDTVCIDAVSQPTEN